MGQDPRLHDKTKSFSITRLEVQLKMKAQLTNFNADAFEDLVKKSVSAPGTGFIDKIYTPNFSHPDNGVDFNSGFENFAFREQDGDGRYKAFNFELRFPEGAFFIFGKENYENSYDFFDPAVTNLTGAIDSSKNAFEVYRDEFLLANPCIAKHVESVDCSTKIIEPLYVPMTAPDGPVNLGSVNLSQSKQAVSTQLKAVTESGTKKYSMDVADAAQGAGLLPGEHIGVKTSSITMPEAWHANGNKGPVKERAGSSWHLALEVDSLATDLAIDIDGHGIHYRLTDYQASESINGYQIESIQRTSGTVTCVITGYVLSGSSFWNFFFPGLVANVSGLTEDASFEIGDVNCSSANSFYDLAGQKAQLTWPDAGADTALINPAAGFINQYTGPTVQIEYMSDSLMNGQQVVLPTPERDIFTNPINTPVFEIGKKQRVPCQRLVLQQFAGNFGNSGTSFNPLSNAFPKNGKDYLQSFAGGWHQLSNVNPAITTAGGYPMPNGTTQIASSAAVDTNSCGLGVCMDPFSSVHCDIRITNTAASGGAKTSGAKLKIVDSYCKTKEVGIFQWGTWFRRNNSENGYF